MIHAFAIQPEMVAGWARRREFRFIHDKFGLGTPRAMLELPAFTKWKKAVHDAALEIGLSQEDLTRLVELFRLFGERRCRRDDSVFDGNIPWLENAESEYLRRSFAGILATANPRGHEAVITDEQLDIRDPRWALPTSLHPARTAAALASALSPMMVNCRALHLVDPYFRPSRAQYRRVIEAIAGIVAAQKAVIRVHSSAELELTYFEGEARKMAAHLPPGVTVEFVRWQQRNGGEKLHNRYVLTDLGGVSLGVGLDSGEAGETEDVQILGPAGYALRWSQYVENNGAFEQVDAPASVSGGRVQARP